MSSQLYTEAIDEDDTNPDFYLKRATAHLRLGRLVPLPMPLLPLWHGIWQRVLICVTYGRVGARGAGRARGQVPCMLTEHLRAFWALRFLGASSYGEAVGDTKSALQLKPDIAAAYFRQGCVVRASAQGWPPGRV